MPASTTRCDVEILTTEGINCCDNSEKLSGVARLSVVGLFCAIALVTNPRPANRQLTKAIFKFIPELPLYLSQPLTA